MSSVARTPDVTIHDDELPALLYVSPEEEWRLFDEAARAWIGMSGEEFVRRWEAGEFASLPDDLEHRRYVDLILTIPVAH